MIDAILDRDAAGDLVTLGVNDVDLESCSPLALAGERVTGRAVGSVRVRLSPTALDGDVTVHDASWAGAGLFVPGVGVLHGDPASMRWTLAGGRLTLAAVELHGPEVELTGTGSVRLADPLGRSDLDLDLAIAPGPGAPAALRDLIARLPPADGRGRRLAVSGTVDAPRVLAP
jgi:hypothetical protein